MHFKAGILAILIAAFGGGSFAAESGGFPFQFKDGLVWIRVASHRSTLNFVLDSGAGSSVLSIRAARRLGVKLGNPLEVQAVDSLTTAYQVHDFTGSVGNIPLKADMLAMDLERASACCCRPIDGLLGQDFFKDRIVQINFRTHRVQLLDHVDGLPATAVLPLRYRNDAMCVPVGVNGLRPKWTRLDTGCDSALEWAANPGKPKGEGKTSVGLADGSEKVILADVQLGIERIAGVKTGLHKHPMFPGEAGLLGCGLLSKYCVTVDGRQMQLLLQRGD